jgi:hypothetical protein
LWLCLGYHVLGKGKELKKSRFKLSAFSLLKLFSSGSRAVEVAVLFQPVVA